MKDPETLQFAPEGATAEEVVDQEREITSLGRFLTDCREALDMSIKQAAEKAGISPVYLGRLEKDEANNPSLNVAWRLSRVYEVSLEMLARHMLGDEERELDQDIEKYHQKIPYIRWDGRYWSRLDLDDKRRYLEFLKSIASSIDSGAEEPVE